MTALRLPAQARSAAKDGGAELLPARAQLPRARISPKAGQCTPDRIAAAGGRDPDSPTVRVRLAAAAGRLTQDDSEFGLAPAVDRSVQPKLRQAARLLEAIVRDALEEASGAEWKLEIALEITEPDSPPFPFLVHSESELANGRHLDPASHASLLYEPRNGSISRLRASADHQAEPPHEPLTESENRVLRYLPTNLSVKEIASELYVSANTVKTHIRHIYAKLDARTRSDAVDRARDLTLLAPRARRPQHLLLR